ncbi:30S ribosome-binding factor RbfA [Kordiimonas pumila]|uniref:Ribosome-binding factor A n=1 Tax=Kordiimonas pumila TaxID=2161677 RepID=A0ABV7D0S2_9PROT|nr:30S ribosome-binding factor RbfA [Kordiimonas pumila]
MSKARHNTSGAPSTRILRVGENVRHAIAMILARGDVQDPLLEKASITVSEARISPDLRNATIFVMPLGGDPSGETVKALNKHSAFIRGAMSRVVHMKYMPSLRFILDESFDEASHIDALLRDPKVARDLEHDEDEAQE